MDLSIYDMKFYDGDKKYIQVYNHIKMAILGGDLSENQKLPPIRTLASKLNVNSITVVNAYKLLEDERLIYKKRGSGCFVLKKKQEIQSIPNESSVYRLDSGNPPSDIFPIGDFKIAIKNTLDEDPTNIFDYDEENGIHELKEMMKIYLHGIGIKCDTHNIMVISGAQNGIDIITKSIIGYSDIIYVEEPTYSGVLDVARIRGARLVSVPLLNDGIDIGILRLKIEKIRPKVIYVMPNFQNPTGITYSEKKKRKLLELAEEYDFYIIEDDFISDFKFLSKNNSTIKSLDKYDRVIYIKSFSKIMMPGLRVGVMVIPSELVRAISATKSSSDSSTSTLVQKSLYHYMNDFNWKKHLSNIENIYTEKFLSSKKYIEDILGKYTSITPTDGGINFFLRLRSGYSADKLVSIAHDMGVIIRSGSNYFDNIYEDRFFRINIAQEPLDRIYEAVDILEKAIKKLYLKK